MGDTQIDPNAAMGPPLFLRGSLIRRQVMSVRPRQKTTGGDPARFDAAQFLPIPTSGKSPVARVPRACWTLPIGIR
jgi:hypothetical protein